ncbi:AI-2E family transporter [Patescibacteria group bacterium]|nr:AI-2E family transporter [Patescibacteria group bacterium]MBU1755130.1 AI-2E family transporter [Patescibacteria group bacterium]
MDKQLSIQITPGTIIMTIVIGAVAFALWTLRDLFLLVVTAVVLASAIEPGVNFFNRYRVPRVFAVLIMYLVVFGSLFSIVYFMFPPILNDAQGFISGIPQYLDTLNLQSTLGSNSSTLLLSGSGDQGQSVLNTLFSFQSAFADSGEGAVRLLSTIFGGILSLILVVVLSFYFALQETGVEDFLRTVTPTKHEEYIVGLWRRAHTKIGLWMQGQLLLSLLVGVIVYLGLLILGVPYALLLAIIAAVFDLVPIFGSFIAGLVAVVVAFGSGGVPLALFVAGLFFVVNQFEAHLIYPLVVNKVVGIPPLLVILALIAGGALAGFLGVLLAVPVAAALREFVSDLDKGKRARVKTT